jgi:predicted lipoprotein with Yx(FWY)xxD motif
MATIEKTFTLAVPLAMMATGIAISSPAASAAVPPAKAGPAVVAMRNGPFGPMLIVGSGKFAGFSLYLFTGDTATSFGCTATIVKALPGGPGSCTGAPTDQKAEWPAFTTVGTPTAGPGVNKALLGTVERPGIGDQVTYAGHPLYGFDNAPGAVTGEGFDEPSLPPWHGLWWLVSPSGSALAWPETLTTTVIGTKTVLAASMLTGIGWENFPVYTYSSDTTGTSNCTGQCAVGWPPLVTNGTPALEGSLATADFTTLKRSDGTTQLAYHGKPLYLFAYEGIAPQGGGYAATGSGNGAKVGGGTFELVSP